MFYGRQEKHFFLYRPFQYLLISALYTLVITLTDTSYDIFSNDSYQNIFCEALHREINAEYEVFEKFFFKIFFEYFFVWFYSKIPVYYEENIFLMSKDIFNNIL